MHKAVDLAGHRADRQHANKTAFLAQTNEGHALNLGNFDEVLHEAAEGTVSSE